MMTLGELKRARRTSTYRIPTEEMFAEYDRHIEALEKQLELVKVQRDRVRLDIEVIARDYKALHANYKAIPKWILRWYGVKV